VQFPLAAENIALSIEKTLITEKERAPEMRCYLISTSNCLCREAEIAIYVYIDQNKMKESLNTFR